MTTVRSGTFSEQGTTSSVVVSKPSGAASGDKLVVFISTEDSATVTCTTRPTGFTRVGGGTEADPVAIDTTGADMRGFAYEKTLGGSEGTTYTFTMSASTYVSWCAICTNGASGAVLSTTVRTQASVGGSDTASISAVTLTTDQLGIAAGCGYENGGLNSCTNWTEPTGSTRMGVYRTTTDATNEIWTIAAGNTRWWSITLVLDAAGGSTPLTVQDATQAHTSDGIALTQHNVLAVDDSVLAHSVDNVSLIQHHTLVAADALHGHDVDAVALTQHNVLAVADATQAHDVDHVVLSGSGAIVPDDSLLAHTADNLTLVQHHVLVVDEAFHGHTVDSLLFGTIIVSLERTFRVRPETRTFTVAADPRTFAVRSESRTYLVEAP